MKSFRTTLNDLNIKKKKDIFPHINSKISTRAKSDSNIQIDK